MIVRAIEQTMEYQTCSGDALPEVQNIEKRRTGDGVRSERKLESAESERD